MAKTPDRYVAYDSDALTKATAINNLNAFNAPELVELLPKFNGSAAQMGMVERAIPQARLAFLTGFLAGAHISDEFWDTVTDDSIGDVSDLQEKVMSDPRKYFQLAVDLKAATPL